MATVSKAKIVAANTPKAGYSGSSSEKTPGAFKIIKMTMTNSKGQKKDLNKAKLVESFTITTELFSPVITFTATIRDNEDFFDKFDICGQETISLEIDPVNTGDAIKQKFFVKEYTNYTKTLDFPNTQIYSLVAISEFAYRSSLMNICRVIDTSKTLDKNIETIFIDDLGLKQFTTEGSVASKFDGIINIQRPLKAAEWIRSRCFDEDGYPFFLFNNITQQDRIFLSSWKSISDSANTNKYYYRQHSKKIPGTAEHTTEERNRILSMSSRIKYDRLGSANAGAYSSRLNVTDYATKAYYTLDFKSKKTDDWTPQTYKIKNRENVQVKTTMHDIPSANTTSIQINSATTPDGNLNSVTAALYPNIQKSNALIARMNEMNHEIVVYGDSMLNPGLKIELEIPKPIREKTQYEIDPVVSGKFIITVAAHIFSNGIYTSKLKLVKLGDVTTVQSVSSSNIITNIATALDPDSSTSTTTATTTPSTTSSATTNNDSSALSGSESSRSDSGKYWFSGGDSPVAEPSLLPPLNSPDPDALPPNFIDQLP